ncbi:hypothetical protein AJ87_10365 [Rhizobium yanglingense]|nr:hypothetical protein AJ87_10365 [Rhizobium yanglingense]
MDVTPIAGGSAGRLTTERPNTTPAAESEVSMKPVKSSFGGMVASTSGRKIVASQTPMMPTGTLIRKIQCQLK